MRARGGIGIALPVRRASGASRGLLAGGLLLAIGAGCGGPDPSRPPHIVFAMIDTLRRDHVSAYGYERETTPVIDGLAERGLLFENVVAQSSWTLPSVMSLFTSRLPSRLAPDLFYVEEQGVAKPARLDDEVSTLAEVLRDGGYRTVSISTNLNASGLTNVLQGFEVQHFEHRGRASWVVDRAIEEIDGFERAAASGERLFLYLHFNDVHPPYEPPPPFDAMFVPPGARERRPHRLAHLPYVTSEHRETRLGPLRRYSLALYDGSLRFLDAQLGRLLEHLDARGLREAAVTVVASDHGEAFWDHLELEEELGLHTFRRADRFGIGHGHTLFPELTAVPLILQGPGIPRARVTEQVRNLDVAPTLLALAGLPADALEAEGRDLLSAWTSGRLEARPAASETRTRAAFQRSLEDETHLYMRLDERELLFDKSEGARRDLSAERPDVLRRLRTTLDARLTERESGPRVSRVELGSEARRQLEELGYLSPPSETP